MLSKQGVGLTFLAQFTESKLGKTGLTVTVNGWRITSAGSSTQVVTGGSATHIGKGVYAYTFSAGSNNADGLLLLVFSTATTSVDQQEVPSCQIVGQSSPSDLVTWKGAAPNDLSTGRVDAYVASGSIAAGAITSGVAPALANLDAAISSVGTNWSGAEKNQIRYRLGLDGSQATPTSAANLSTLTATGVWTHGSRGLTEAVTVHADSKSGFKLAADGLDSISADEPTGVATTFRGKLLQVWARFFRRTRRTATAVEVYQSNGTTLATTQAWSESGSTQEVGAAT